MSPARHRLSGILALAAALLTVPALAGCGAARHPGATAVVASTDVWASVARAVTGPHVAVRSILAGADTDTDTDTDPHAYQVSASDAAAIADAALVVYNGGGYDPWVDQALAGHPGVRSVDAYSLLGAADAPPAGQPPDQHVFYDLNVAKAVASAIADRMAVIDAANAADYRANAAAFGRSADAIVVSERAIASAYPDTGVIATEPVVHYLLAASGLVNRASAAFTAASEDETDPAPADLASALDLIDHRQVSALLVNPQTATAAVGGLQEAARHAGVPVTEVTETLPDGVDYLTWQRNTVEGLRAALRSDRQTRP